jgi:hypothetical protein
MPTIESMKRLATRLKKAKAIPHHEALDLAAQQHGYANWAHAQTQVQTEHSVQGANPYELALERIMAEHPYLTAFGIGSFRERRETQAEYDARFKRDRTELRNYVQAFRVVSEWLKRLPSIKTINRSATSYGLKHIVEREVGYITNGLFIAAAIHAGFKVAIRHDSPNVCLNIGRMAWKAEAQRIEAMERRGYRRPSPPGHSETLPSLND